MTSVSYSVLRTWTLHERFLMNNMDKRKISRCMKHPLDLYYIYSKFIRLAAKRCDNHDSLPKFEVLMLRTTA